MYRSGRGRGRKSIGIFCKIYQRFGCVPCPLTKKTPREPFFGSLLGTKTCPTTPPPCSTPPPLLPSWSAVPTPRTMVFMTPSPGINYNFVAGAYLVCSVIFGVLLALDKVGARRSELCSSTKSKCAILCCAETALLCTKGGGVLRALSDLLFLSDDCRSIAAYFA